VRIIKYPHPTLRHRSKPLRRIDGEVKRLVRQMFDLMYEFRGIGLAANQVDLPYRVFIVNPSGDQAARDEECVLINPQIVRRNGMAEGEEGCLSFPEIYAPVKRSEKVVMVAYNLSGEEMRYEVSGLVARALQHEYDHLDGVLFIDRLSPAALLSIKQDLGELESEFEGDRDRGLIPADDQITARLAELEALQA
jgi:peptide deformylase